MNIRFHGGPCEGQTFSGLNLNDPIVMTVTSTNSQGTAKVATATYTVRRLSSGEPVIDTEGLVEVDWVPK